MKNPEKPILDTSQTAARDGENADLNSWTNSPNPMRAANGCGHNPGHGRTMEERDGTALRFRAKARRDGQVPEPARDARLRSNQDRASFVVLSGPGSPEPLETGPEFDA